MFTQNIQPASRALDSYQHVWKRTIGISLEHHFCTFSTFQHFAGLTVDWNKFWFASVCPKSETLNTCLNRRVPEMSCGPLVYSKENKSNHLPLQPALATPPVTYPWSGGSGVTPFVWPTRFGLSTHTPPSPRLQRPCSRSFYRLSPLAAAPAGSLAHVVLLKFAAGHIPVKPSSRWVHTT